MLDDLQTAALEYRQVFGIDRLHTTLAPFCRPGRRVELSLVIDKPSALAALRRELRTPELAARDNDGSGCHHA